MSLPDLTDPRATAFFLDFDGTLVELAERPDTIHLAERTRDVVIDEFEKAGAAVAPVYKPSELLSDPQVNAIEMVTTVEDDDLGPVRMQNVMWRMGGSPGRIRHTGRRHGADTDDVLSELGCTADEIEAMRRDSVV